VLKAHIASICFKYFRCFRGLLEVFHKDVAMVAHVCCKRLFFRPTLHVCLSGCSYVSHVCCKLLSGFCSLVWAETGFYSLVFYLDLHDLSENGLKRLVGWFGLG
jgi:hypothetical protein